ncbi:hypothetical protein [Herpetosiphon llansteffanensis]|uniref:hypothetical protein n=1 Tax=Herpetosiphon llansteffanensis TaxID=2094568 RepID=UPI000D7BE695|nr:hypothetical protein [Herpetosiphon llansteffanensis]
MRLSQLTIGIMLGCSLVACGGNQAPSPTNAPIPTATVAPTEQLVEVTVTYLDDAELDTAFSFGTANDPIVKGEMLMMASTDRSFAFEVVDFERGAQALTTITTLDPTYAGPPAGYEVGLVRAKITHGRTHPEPVVLDGAQISLLVFSNAEYRSVKDMQGLPCCFEPRFDTPVAKGEMLEVYFPILVALDDPNPLLVINRDNADNADAEHFALQ